jgi:hypothetical protein
VWYTCDLLPLIGALGGQERPAGATPLTIAGVERGVAGARETELRCGVLPASPISAAPAELERLVRDEVRVARGAGTVDGVVAGTSPAAMVCAAACSAAEGDGTRMAVAVGATLTVAGARAHAQMIAVQATSSSDVRRAIRRSGNNAAKDGVLLTARRLMALNPLPREPALF